VCDPAEADFILAHGTEAIGLQDDGTQDRSLQQLMDLLQQCADIAKQRGTEMPMVVANPDLVGGGSSIRGPGEECSSCGSSQLPQEATSPDTQNDEVRSGRCSAQFGF
jgi:hypothetical protein